MRPALRQPPVAPHDPPHRRFRPDGVEVTTPPVDASSPAGNPRHGLYAGEPEACRRTPRQFLPILLHLALLVAVSRVYRLEGRAFQLLIGLSLAALPVHYLLPFRWKQPAFVAASIAGLVAVFGLSTAAFVLPAAAVLIGITRLGVAWRLRAGLIAALAVAFALVRAGTVGLPAVAAVPDLVWPVLGTMFMFRMILYLYELKHAKAPERLGDTLAYFFLLPNYAFLHFPVMDYRTQRRGYFAADIHTIQRRGLAMVVRGVTHLLLYRLVYHLLLIPADEVHDLASFARYVACNYMLYLRVSGQFHVACGMLHLFGYQLPETHHHYLLATGFTDYWRRINIYWKDFMVRVVFNPVVFRLKKRPQGLALAVATVAVFLTTWALHAYQSFWLRGRWGFSAPDALFWGILGVLVLINVRNDARRSRAAGRSRNVVDRSARAIGVRTVKTVGTFTTIALLWSLWSSPSLTAWIDLLRRAFS